MPPTKLTGKDQAYYELGDFIFDQNPYAAEVEIVDVEHPNNSNPKDPDVAMDGPGAKFHSKKPFKVPTSKTGAEFMEGLFWYFKGAPRRVSKAIRIKYTYKLRGKKVTEHLLIGYEGSGGH